MANKKIRQTIMADIHSILSKKEISKANHFKKKADKRTYIIGKYLTKKIISEYLKVEPENITVEADKNGRPHLHKPKISRFDFNLSHSGDWIVFAFVGAGQIGIDIEKIRPINLRIAREYFTPSEQSYAFNDKTLDNFYKLWTLKESYTKAIGKGLSFPLKKCEFIFKSNRVLLKVKNKNTTKWSFKTFKIDRIYQIAVCADKKSAIDDIIINKIPTLKTS